VEKAQYQRREKPDNQKVFQRVNNFENLKLQNRPTIVKKKGRQKIKQHSSTCVDGSVKLQGQKTKNFLLNPVKK